MMYLGLLIIGSTFFGVWIYLLVDSFQPVKDSPEDSKPEHSHVTVISAPYDWEKEGW